MRVRATAGTAPGWTGIADIYEEAIWIQDEPWCPMDAEENGLVILEATGEERRLAAELGFELHLLQ